MGLIICLLPKLTYRHSRKANRGAINPGLVVCR